MIKWKGRQENTVELDLMFVVSFFVFNLLLVLENLNSYGAALGS